MFIQGFEGSWFDHPFWRTRFVLTKERDLERVRESSVAAVFIDDERGVAPNPRIEISRPAADWQPPSRPTPYIHSRSVPAQRPTDTFASSYTRALKVFGRSKRAVTAMYSDVRLGKAVKAEKLVPLVDEITTSIDQNPQAFLSIAQLKSRHEYHYMHSVAVCALMINLGRELRFSEAAVRDAGMAGLLHDIGKAVMPAEVLDKPGELTPDEFDIMKTHPVRGRELLARSSGVSHNALDVCLHHHERFDGSGYPDALPADRITIFSRMAALCDVYDAVTSERCYKRPWTPVEAVQTMRGWSGHFDPDMFELFVKSVGIYPAGALVRLKSGRTAVVIGENPDDPSKPPLFSMPDENSPQAERIDLGSDEIVGMESEETLAIEDWGTKRTALIKRFRS